MKGVIKMAKKTINREEIVKKLVELEGNLMDYIPENEKGTDRVKLLDRIMAVNAGEEKLGDDEMQKLYEEGASLLKVETEVKKAKKSAGKKKAEEKSEDKTEGKPKKKLPAKKEKAEPKADAPKKEKKSVSKKKKEEPVKEEKPAFEFPKELETEEDGVYKQAKIKKLIDIEEGDLVAGQWTEEDLKEFEYDNTGALRIPKKFEQDIDVCVVLAVSEEIVYALSIATNKMYHFTAEDVPTMDSNGMLWRVYKPVGE